MSERHGSEAVDARPVRSADARQPGFGEVLAAADLPLSGEHTWSLTHAAGGAKPSRLPSLGGAVEATKKHAKNAWTVSHTLWKMTLGNVIDSAHVFFHTIGHALHELAITIKQVPLAAPLFIVVGIPAMLAAATILTIWNLGLQFFSLGHMSIRQ